MHNIALSHPEYSVKAISQRDDPAFMRRAMQGFFAIMRQWAIDNNDAMILLGLPSKRTFYAWKKGEVKTVPADTLRRIGYIAGIFKALEILYSNAQLADGWTKRGNRYFGGQTPLQRMTAGDVTDLAVVRQYLDAARAAWS